MLYVCQNRIWLIVRGQFFLREAKNGLLLPSVDDFFEVIFKKRFDQKKIDSAAVP